MLLHLDFMCIRIELATQSRVKIAWLAYVNFPRQFCDSGYNICPKWANKQALELANNPPLPGGFTLEAAVAGALLRQQSFDN